MRVLVWTGAFACVIYWIVLFARSRWRKVRDAMQVVPPRVMDLQRPGLIGENFKPIQWTMAVRGCLERAVRFLQQADAAPARAAAEAVKAIAPIELELAELTRAAAVRTLATGDVQSLLARNGQLNFYAVVFPARDEHARLFRRYPPFRDGWIEHIARLRSALAAEGEGEGNTLPILCLLYFLNPGGEGGVLLLAYEAATAHLLPADLIDESETPGDNSFRCAEKFVFQLACTIGTVLSPGTSQSAEPSAAEQRQQSAA